ncbi:DUF1788 domain-containing protein [Spirosoma validum]|uniref:DUF1788 domain-containing protein n=1 Tax=Spirosoma validum TaxID=2771355 RepID=A0A927GGW4_9BACT|nr:DUF1788 domain-containing protein [Spirosoma validum]MBD2757118.1 DUF1788 domain-containing protein [Spirosoma validum]
MITTSSLTDQFDHLFAVIRSPGFLRKEALGGEIGFFIHAYEPVQQAEVEQATARLINRLKQQGVLVVEINLYTICIDLLTEQNRLDQIIERESSMPKEKLLRAMQSSLSVEGRLVPAIEARLAQTPHQVVFLTGVGQVFPFIRSHTVLNNLQRVITQPPLVIFFPGQYNGRSLELFGLLHDDNYYRAFNLANLHS